MPHAISKSLIPITLDFTSAVHKNMSSGSSLSPECTHIQVYLLGHKTAQISCWDIGRGESPKLLTEVSIYHMIGWISSCTRLFGRSVAFCTSEGVHYHTHLDIIVAT